MPEARTFGPRVFLAAFFDPAQRRVVTLSGRRKALPVFPRYFKHSLDLFG